MVFNAIVHLEPPFSPGARTLFNFPRVSGPGRNLLSPEMSPVPPSRPGERRHRESNAARRRKTLRETRRKFMADLPLEISRVSHLKKLKDYIKSRWERLSLLRSTAGIFHFRKKGTDWSRKELSLSPLSPPPAPSSAASFVKNS